MNKAQQERAVARLLKQRLRSLKARDRRRDRENGNSEEMDSRDVNSEDKNSGGNGKEEIGDGEENEASPDLPEPKRMRSEDTTDAAGSNITVTPMVEPLPLPYLNLPMMPMTLSLSSFSEQMSTQLSTPKLSLSLSATLPHSPKSSKLTSTAPTSHANETSVDQYYPASSYPSATVLCSSTASSHHSTASTAPSPALVPGDSPFASVYHHQVEARPLTPPNIASYNVPSPPTSTQPSPFAARTSLTHAHAMRGAEGCGNGWNRPTTNSVSVDPVPLPQGCIMKEKYVAEGHYLQPHDSQPLESHSQASDQQFYQQQQQYTMPLDYRPC